MTCWIPYLDPFWIQVGFLSESIFSLDEFIEWTISSSEASLDAFVKDDWEGLA